MEGQPVPTSNNPTEGFEDHQPFIDSDDEAVDTEHPEPGYETPESSFVLGRISLGQTLELAEPAMDSTDNPTEEVLDDEEAEQFEPEVEKDLPPDLGKVQTRSEQPQQAASGLDITDEQTRMAALEFIFPVTMVPADELVG